MPLYAKIDVSLPDDPKMAEAGDLAELAYLRCILRGRENLTDGVIDRRVVKRWLVGIRGKAETHMAALVKVGLLELHPDGWRIPLEVWKKWNPLKAEVEAKRAEDAERKRKKRTGESTERPSGQGADSGWNPEGVQTCEKQQPEPEPKSEPAAADVAVEDEVTRRVDARRRRGEDIGPGLIKLIRQDVIAARSLPPLEEDDGPTRCLECEATFMSGAGVIHAIGCPLGGFSDAVKDLAQSKRLKLEESA